MTDTDRKRLAAILGMLGSNSAGERDAAALQAEAFRRKHGLTWEEMLAVPQPADEAVSEPPPPPAPEPPAWVPPARPQSAVTYGWDDARIRWVAGMGLVFGIALIILRTLLGGG